MFNKKKFAELLRAAIGERTTTTYADLTGVNRTYISKLLNEKLDNPPSPDIIKGLASKAYAGVIYEDFMTAAGYLPDNKHNDGTAYELLETVGEYNSDSRTPLPPDAMPVGETKKVPVLGVIRAGEPIYADEHIIGYEDVPVSDLKGGEYFFLMVQGDSMIGSRIYPGDKVLVRKQNYVEDNEIAVVLVNGYEATLKRVKPIEEAVILYPDNPKYEPQIYKAEEVRIIGRVKKVVFEI